MLTLDGTPRTWKPPKSLHLDVHQGIRLGHGGPMLELRLQWAILVVELDKIIAVEIVTELLRFILAEIELHEYPPSLGVAMPR